MSEQSPEEVQAEVQELVSEAIRREREQCASMVEGMGLPIGGFFTGAEQYAWLDALKTAAARIRARGGKP